MSLANLEAEKQHLDGMPENNHDETQPERRPLRRQPEEHHFWSLIMLVHNRSPAGFLLLVGVLVLAACTLGLALTRGGS